MSNSLCFTPLCCSASLNKPGVLIRNSKTFQASRVLQSYNNPSKFQSLQVKATDDKRTKTSTIVCPDCDGNGAVLCKQCKGAGINSVDHFNGQFKAGGLCWLCRGKRDILCGNCNGAGFVGGFMSSFDD